MTRRLLDLFCGAGGAAMGYHRAGFDEVVGVDHVPQPDYPFEFVRADATTFPLDGFDAVHASPPCKRFTPLSALRRPVRLFEPDDDLLTPTLARLRAHGGVWIVENVPGAPMPEDAIRLCGSSFGLRVRRHRLFVASTPLYGKPCRHDEQGSPVGVYGEGGAWTAHGPFRGGTKVAGADAADALGVDWTTRQTALAQAIPPAYTEYLGRQLLDPNGLQAPR